MKKCAKKLIKVCLKCGSTDIGLPGLKSLIYRKGSIIQPVVGSGAERCRKCDYHGIMLEMEKDKVKKFVKELEKVKKKR